MADTKVAPETVEKKEETIATVVEAPATSKKSKEAVESVQSGFEIINKETENKVTANIAEKKHELSIKDEKESSPKESTDFDKNEKISKENLTKISEPVTTALVDVAVIKEFEKDDNVSPKEELENALNAMPGMTKSVSKEVLAQATDKADVEEIIENIEKKSKDDPDGGTLIDIAVVAETETEKDVQEVIKEAEISFQAEVIEDEEDVQVVPAEDEEVLEYTIEMRHAIPVLTVLVGFIAVFYAIIFHYN